MFSFLKKKLPPYPLADRWTVLTGTHQGKPMFIRRNESAQTLKGHPQYIHRVGVVIPLLEPTGEGLPLGKEMETLKQIEDALSAPWRMGRHHCKC